MTGTYLFIMTYQKNTPVINRQGVQVLMTYVSSTPTAGRVIVTTNAELNKKYEHHL